MTETMLDDNKVSDAPSDNWAYKILPQSLWPHAQLARWDRPIGWQLLLWPCLWSLGLALSAPDIEAHSDVLFKAVYYGILFLVGAIAMRGAGCTYNDLVDHKLDAQVERTRSRPLPAGRIDRKAAKIFILLQLIVGGLVLVQFNWFTIFLALASMIVVAIYPFAKRFTNWPQFFLGLAFSWGAFLGWSAFYENVSLASICLYLAAICWTIGYDTIYAHQDREDDALVGVRSTARLFAENTKSWLMLFFGLTILCLAVSVYLASGGLIAYLALLLTSALFIWQIKVLDIHDAGQCLALFHFNNYVGGAVFLGLVISALV